MDLRRWALVRGSAAAAAAALMLAPLGSARALGIRIVSATSTGASPSRLGLGDRITVGLRLENPARLPVQAIGISAWGYDVNRDGYVNDGLRFVGGVRSESIFASSRAAGSPLGGLEFHSPGPTEIRSGIQGNTDPDPGATLGLYVSAIQSISLLTSASGDGSLDRGVAGGWTDADDVHLQLTFQATSVADDTDLKLHFGIGDPRRTGQQAQYGSTALTSAGEPFFENAVHALRILADPDHQPWAPPPPPPARLSDFGLARPAPGSLRALSRLEITTAGGRVYTNGPGPSDIEIDPVAARLALIRLAASGERLPVAEGGLQAALDESYRRAGMPTIRLGSLNGALLASERIALARFDPSGLASRPVPEPGTALLLALGLAALAGDRRGALSPGARARR